MTGNRLYIGVLFVLLLVVQMSCDSTGAPDCLKTEGSLRTEVRELNSFSRLLINENLRVIIRQGDVYRAEVEAGENLMEAIQTVIEGDRLILTNENTCNYFRPYGSVTVTITVPDLREIRMGTQFDVRSEGVLQFPSVSLIAENFIIPDLLTNGEFDLSLESERISMVLNGASYSKIRGTTNVFSVTIAANDARIEAADLTANRVQINHRGSNDIFVTPLSYTGGDLFGTGNLVLTRRPDTLEVTEHYRGRVILP